MTRKEKTPERICRTFKRDFPEFVERAEALGVRINASAGKRANRAAVYWLDGYRQLTGYTTRSNGAPFTHEDAVKNIDDALAAVEDDRQKIAVMSEDERFARVIDQFRQMEVQYRMLGEVRFPSGDGGGVFFNASYDGEVRLAGIGTVASAKAEWVKGVGPKEQMATFCDLLDQNYAARRARAAEGDAA